MSDLIPWLRAQILARKDAAEQATGTAWRVEETLVERPDGGGDEVARLIDAERGDTLVEVTFGRPSLTSYDLQHMALNDPAQVIRDCEADLALLDAHLGYYGAGDDEFFPIPTLRILTTKYGIQPESEA